MPITVLVKAFSVDGFKLRSYSNTAHGCAGCLNLFSVGHSIVLLLLDLHMFFPKDAFQ